MRAAGLQPDTPVLVLRYYNNPFSRAAPSGDAPIHQMSAGYGTKYYGTAVTWIVGRSGGNTPEPRRTFMHQDTEDGVSSAYERGWHSKVRRRTRSV